MDDLGKMLGCICTRLSTTDKIDHSMEKDGNKNVSVGERFGREQLSTMSDVVNVVRTAYIVTLFHNASEYPNHCYQLEQILQN